MDMESKQVTEASSNAQEIYDGLSALPTSDVIMPSNRRVDTWDEIIYIPEGVEQYIVNDVKFAGMSTSTIKCGDDALIVDGGATSTCQNRLRTVLKSDHKCSNTDNGWHNVYIY